MLVLPGKDRSSARACTLGRASSRRRSRQAPQRVENRIVSVLRGHISYLSNRQAGKSRRRRIRPPFGGRSSHVLREGRERVSAVVSASRRRLRISPPPPQARVLRPPQAAAP